MAANHDSYYKLLFSHPELVHDLLVEFVSVVRSDTLQLDTLQRVNGSYTSKKRVLLNLSEWLADSKHASLRRDFSLFASSQLRRKVKDPTIPETADLLEIRSMLEERGMDWWEQWKLEGVREGERKGILVGEARLLHRLLERRFGSLPTWVEARLAKAVEEDLVRWGERVLDPTVSLEQLLRS